MNLMTLKNGASAVFNVSKMFVKDHAPQILIGVAIGSEVGAIVSSCYAMTKMPDIIDAHKEAADSARFALKNGDISKEEYQRAITKVYINTGVDSVKYWALPVALTGVSITSGLAAYNKINKKYVGAMASLATISDKFRTYRDNVVEDAGIERDKIYLNNGILKAKALRLHNGNTKNGTEQQYTDKEINKAMCAGNPEEILEKSATNDVAKAYMCSNNPYEFEWSRDTVDGDIFNEHSHNYNVNYVIGYRLQYWNDRLQVNGIVTLNEVLRSIGLTCYMSSEFDDIGWCKKKYDERCDGFIDFGFDKEEVVTPERQMWKEPTPYIDEMFRKNPDTDRVMLVMNCCDIREAKKQAYGDYFGKDGKLNLLTAYRNV